MALRIPNFKNYTILVVGDVMLDKYWEGTSDRVSPEAPVPIVNVSNISEKLGGAANVAKNIVSLGANCILVGSIGSDDNGNRLKTILEETNIKHSFDVDKEKCTITKHRVLSHSQQLLRFDIEDKNNPIKTENFKKNLKNADLVIFSDYGKGALSKIEDLIKIAINNKKNILIDPKGIDWNKYKGASILTPNLSEFKSIVGDFDSDDELIEKGTKLIDKLELKALLVTRGEDGMTLINNNGKSFSLSSDTKSVFDVTGAGDTVIASLACCLSADMEIEESIKVSNTAAGIVVGKVGSASVSVSEIKNSLGIANKYLGEKININFFNHIRIDNKKIVMTNGCFDILHPGHIDYLQRAKSLGDILVVAVNNDSSIQKIKGHNRPINNLESRVRLLSSLACVDFVVSFSAETPIDVITSIKPDILVKGGDYEVKDIIGYESVVSNGGVVKVLPFVDGFSTTNIINKIIATQEN